MKHLLFFTCVVALVFVSCKTKKTVTKVTENKVIGSTLNIAEINTAIVAKQNKAEYLYYTADADYRDENINQSLSLEVQAQANNLVWINVKVLFVNVARIMLKPDSIRIIDYINRQYISASYNFLNKFTNAPMQYNQLQNLVYGNLLFEPNSNNLKIDSTANGFLLTTALNMANQLSWHSKTHLKAEKLNLVETEKQQNMEVSYANFQNDGQNMWPQSIAIHIQAKKVVDCKFSISNLATVKIKEPQFAVPRSYKVLVY